MKKFLVCIFVMLFSLPSFCQSISVEDLISKSIDYHDPDRRLFKELITMDFIETRPGGQDRFSSISFNIAEEFFQMENTRDDLNIKSKLLHGTSEFSINGSTNISEEQAKKYRLNHSRLNMMKNYYEYLWLMPLKLNDPGTKVDSNVKKVDFFGKESLEIRVTYAEEVGKDIWYFYFNPTTYAMQGYRFYHDEVKNDGEYIILDEETVSGSIRLPKRRTWYTHKEDKLLGTDILDKLRF